MAMVRYVSLDGYAYLNRRRIKKYVKVRAASSKFNPSTPGRAAQPAEWKVRFPNVPVLISDEKVLEFLRRHRVHGCRVERVNLDEVDVCGGENGEEARLYTYKIRERAFVPPHQWDSGVEERNPLKRRRSDGNEDERPSKKLLSTDFVLRSIGQKLNRLKPVIREPKQPVSGLSYTEQIDELLSKKVPVAFNEQSNGSPEDDDLPVPKVWSGPIQMGLNGDRANVDAYLVLRTDQNVEELDAIMKQLPEELVMKSRVDADDPGFEHLLNENAAVFMVREDEDECREKMSKSPNSSSKVTSRGVILGILKYLKEREKCALVRYTPKGSEEKMAALVCAPTEAILESLHLPWRFREVIGHDTLLMVVGRKARSSEVTARYL